MVGSGVDVVWSADERDPIVFLSALSQMVPELRIGLFVSSLGDRPALLAARQLITLDHLSDGRLELAVDDVDSYKAIQRIFYEQLPPSSRILRAPVWGVNNRGVGMPAVFRETFAFRDQDELERRDIRCVITRFVTP